MALIQSYPEMVRPPKNLSTNFTFKSGVIKTGESVLEHELMAEKAHSLGLAATRLESSLKNLSEAPSDSDTHAVLIQTAANAAQAFFIQRELMGMNNHTHPIAYYKIPKEVLARIGAA